MFLVLYIFLLTSTTFQAHKYVLASRSEVFEKKMEDEWKEREEIVVRLDNFGANTVQAAVEFCYDQEITQISELALSLLRFADKYMINDLKVSFCKDDSRNNLVF